MTRQEFVDYCVDALNQGTLLSPKHDPASVGTPFPGYRTVSTMDAPALLGFFQSGDYQAFGYTNTNPRHTPYYVEIIPTNPSVVPGSGVPPMSGTPATRCDRFVAVSGVQQGWHLFAEDSQNIQAKESQGALLSKYELL